MWSFMAWERRRPWKGIFSKTNFCTVCQNRNIRDTADWEMLALIDQKECKRCKFEKVTNQNLESTFSWTDELLLSLFHQLLCKYCPILPTCYKLFCTVLKASLLCSGKHFKTYNHLVYQLDERQPWRENLFSISLRNFYFFYSMRWILEPPPTCMLLQWVLPLLTAEQHHQLNHRGRRFECVDCLVMRIIRTMIIIQELWYDNDDNSS